MGRRGYLPGGRAVRKCLRSSSYFRSTWYRFSPMRLASSGRVNPATFSARETPGNATRSAARAALYRGAPVMVKYRYTLPPDLVEPPLVARFPQLEAAALHRVAALRPDPVALGLAAPPALAEELVDLLEDGVEGPRLALEILGGPGLDQLGPDPPALELARLVGERPLVVEDRRGDLLDLEHAAVGAALDGVDHHRRHPLEGQVVAALVEGGHQR